MDKFIKALPEGWTETNGIRRSSSITVGQFSALLKDGLKDRLRFNLLTLKPELDGVEIPATDITYLYVKLGESGWTISKEQAKDALIYASQNNCFDPVQEYLLDLEQQEKDLKLYPADIDSVASDYLGVKDEFSNKMVKIWLVGQVRRAFHRGCKHDTMLVLQGGQGIGKSSFFSSLMPNPDFFADTPTIDPKDRLMVIQSCWCYEVQELENLTSKVEAGKVKALITSSYDTFRPPYASALIKSPRPSLMVGSANKTQLLNDETGHRRFHFVKVSGAINIERVKEDRDAIWLSAIKAFREGFVPILDTEESQLSENRSSEFEKENEFYSVVAEWIESAPDYFTTRQCFLGTQLIDQYEAPRPLDVVQVGKALKALGYEQKQRRINKVRDRYWSKKEIVQAFDKNSGESGGVPDVPKSKSDDVTPNSPAVVSDSGDCPNVTTQNKENNNSKSQPHKAVRWETSVDNVTPKKTFGKVVVGYNSTSQHPNIKMSQEERIKAQKEIDEYWERLNK